MSTAQTVNQKSKRIHWMDNLRTVIIALVVLYHVGGVYETAGLWFSSFHLSSLVMVYVLVESFWCYLEKPGKIWQELSGNSYGVYIIHVIVIGIFGTLLLGVNLPGWAKYPILFILSYTGSNLLVSLYPPVKQALKRSPAPESSTLPS